MTDLQSPSGTISKSPPTPRRNQGTFCSEEQDFLKSFLPEYRSLLEDLAKIASGPRGIKGTKGRKKNWVIKTVFPKFVSHFDSAGEGGPNLGSLKIAMTKWFTNKVKGSNLDSYITIPPTPTISMSKPRAITAIDLFAKDHASDIRQKMATKRMAEGTTPQESNLNYHHEIKSQLFNASDNATKAKYEADATARNAKLSSPPEPSEIFKNQQDILATTSATLRSICGWDRGQHGDVALFLMGAFRDEKKKLKLFNVSVADNPDVSDFTSMLPDFKKDLRAPFKTWAVSVLPAIETNEQPPSNSESEAKPTITIGDDGYPVLPNLSGESIPPQLLRDLLRDFISATWDLAVHNLELENMGIPWDAMSLPQRLMYMADDSLSSFPDLDPVNMSREHVYLIFDAILASQSKQERFIKFSIARDALRKLQPGGDEGCIDEEIIELDDPPKSPSKSHKRSPRKSKTKSPSKPPNQEFIDFSPPFGSITSDTSQRTEFPLATPPVTTLPVASPSKVTASSLAPPIDKAMDLSQSSSNPAFKKQKTKATTAPKKLKACKRKADVEGTISAGPAPKKRKGMVIAPMPALAPKKTKADKRRSNDGVDASLGPKGFFSPRKPSARIRKADYVHKSVSLHD